MSASARPRSGLLRVGLVVLLALAAFFAGLPWLGCLAGHPLGIFAFARDDFFMLRVCTSGVAAGFPSLGFPPLGLPGFNGPYWGNLAVGIFYLVAALYAARTKRSL